MCPVLECGPLLAVSCKLSAVSCWLSAASCRLSAASCKLSAVSSVSWDGTDDRGRELAPGVYFCRLVVTGVGHDPAPMTEKLVLQR